MRKAQYAVWETDGADEDAGFWLMYDSLEGAVSEKGSGVEVYRGTFKFVGRYKRAVKIIRIKARKRADRRMRR